MPEKPDKLVPARYIGNAVNLGEGMAYYNIDGTRRRKPSLEPGDTMMMRAEDIYGKTLLNNPNDGSQLYLGLGRVVLPEDVNKAPEELGKYEFHMPRTDFEPLESPAESPTTQEASEQQSDAMTLEVDSDAVEEAPAQHESEVS